MSHLVRGFETLPDATVIERVLSGEIELFEILIRRHNPYLYRIGRSHNYCHEDVEDLMQDTFVHAYTSLRQFQQRSSFKTWLIRIMLSNCYHFGRKARVRYEVPVETLPDTHNFHAASDERRFDTSHMVVQRELTNVIEQALLRIPASHRDVFVLREANGLSVSETAELLELSESNVKVQLMRAKGMLRQEIMKTYCPEDIFEFNLVYCDAMVRRVMTTIAQGKID